MRGTHHYRVEREHLQYYLDEFTFRFNRRRSAGPRHALLTGYCNKASTPIRHPLHELIGGIDRPEPLDLPNEASDAEALVSDAFGEF